MMDGRAREISTSREQLYAQGRLGPSMNITVSSTIHLGCLCPLLSPMNHLSPTELAQTLEEAQIAVALATTMATTIDNDPPHTAADTDAIPAPDAIHAPAPEPAIASDPNTEDA